MSNSIKLSLSPVPNAGAGSGVLSSITECDKTDKDVNGVALLILHHIGNNKWACRIVLEYLINEDIFKQAILNFNARIVKETPKECSCKEPVTKPSKFKSLEKTLAKVDFPLEIGSTEIECVVSAGVGKLVAKVKSHPISHPRYDFIMSFSDDGILEIEASFIYTLSKWCRIGEESGWFCERRGLPTAKVIMTLMMRKLGVTRDNLKTIKLNSANPLTLLHFLYELFANKRTMNASFANAHSSQLNAELAETLGGKLFLENICCDEKKGRHIKDMDLLRNRFWRMYLEQEHNSMIEKQLIDYLSIENLNKFIKLRSTTGIDVFEDRIWVPDMINFQYRFEKLS